MNKIPHPKGRTIYLVPPSLPLIITTITIPTLPPDKKFDMPFAVSIFLINHSNTISGKQALIHAFTSDFPAFSYCCELSPNNICANPTLCPKVVLALTGYYEYNNTKDHHYNNLPQPPEPIFHPLCQGCGLRHSECKEGCKLFAEELWGYTVFAWDFIDRNFMEQVIHKDLLNPRLHGFFSYKNWRAEQTGRKRKHREWEHKRKNKRQRTEASTSNDAQRLSPEPPTPRVSSTSPKLL